jgi:hypothetical protein
MNTCFTPRRVALAGTAALACLGLAAPAHADNGVLTIKLGYSPAYCLANVWNTDTVETAACDSNAEGQQWKWDADSGQLSLAQASGYCLANVAGSSTMHTEACDASVGTQQWNVKLGDTNGTISLRAGTYCVDNVWNTPKVDLKQCDGTQPQAWLVTS